MFGFFSEGKYKEGLRLLKSGRLEEALSHFSSLQSKNPSDAFCAIQIAKIHFRKKDYAESKNWLKKALGQKLNDDEVREVLDLTNFKKLSGERYLNSYPVFSPDGNWVAFTSARSDQRAGLYMVHVGTGEERCLAPEGSYNSQPYFSRDGGRIAYLSARRDSNQDGKIDHTDDAGLYVQDLAGGKEECLVEGIHRPKFPSFSPDGQTLLFCGWHSNSPVCRVYLMDLNSRVIRSLQNLFESNFPVLSPNGDHVIYACWKTDTNKDGVIDLRDNSALMEVNVRTGIERVLVSDEYSNSYPEFSPDGKNIVYLSRRRDTNNDGIINSLDNSGIYILDLDSGRERPVAGDDYHNRFPSFSHDAKRVVFVGSPRDKKTAGSQDPEDSAYFETKGIYSVGSDGRNLREIVSAGHYGSRFLATSPRSNHVAYVSWRKDTNRGLYLAPFDRLPSQEELKEIVEKF